MTLLTPSRGFCPLCNYDVPGAIDEGGHFLPRRGAGHKPECRYGTPTLVRLRADPSKVRISVRRVVGGWLATIQERSQLPTYTVAADKMATRAVAMALRHAENIGMPGIDLGLQWAYEHPQGESKET